MGMRNRIGKNYVERKKDGTFSKWTSIARAQAIDRAKNAKTQVKSGFGHKGDIKVKKR